MMKKLLKINIILVIFFININNIVFAEDITESVSDSLEVNKYLSSFETFIEENNIEGFDIKSIYSELISGQGVNYNNIIDIFVSNLVVQVKESAKTVSTLFIIIVIMAVLSSLQLDKNSDVVKISKLIVIICVSSILLKNYIEIVNMFKDIVNVLSSAMQIVSTFLTGILIASGKITTTGIIQPLLVFIASFICVVTEYIVIPFFTISIAISIVSKISDNLKDPLKSCRRIISVQ